MPRCGEGEQLRQHLSSTLHQGLICRLEGKEAVPLAESYHSWSSNSRWLVFASKRDDGVYGKPYFCHVAEDGTCSKSFVLPQRHTDYYDNLLKSFNAPELGKGPLPFSTYDVREILECEPTPFK